MTAKQTFRRVGWSLLTAVGSLTVISIVLGAALAVIKPDYMESPWTAWLTSFLPVYLAALPLGYAVLAAVPGEKQNQMRLGAKNFFVFLLICFPIMYGGNLLGTLLHAMGGEYPYGSTIYDFAEGDQRGYKVYHDPYVDVTRRKSIRPACKYGRKENVQTYMPGFTHLQKAQPITFAHHMGAYMEMFKRDHSRLTDIYHRMNLCPIGSGALAGTTYPLDRNMTAELLGFDGPCENSMDGVSDRDYVIAFLDSLAITMMHLSRLSEEIITWNSTEYQSIDLDDTYATGSSIMPQKKNPDIAELIRGKTGRVYGALMSMLTTMKGLPLAYDKDMQEDKELTFDAIDTTKGCIRLMAGMLETSKFNADRMAKSCQGGFANATDAADYLVRKGMPFRDAHGVIGRLVLTCIRKNCRMDDLPLEDYRKESPLFDSDIYEAIALKTCVDRRMTKGAPGAIDEEIRNAKAYLDNTEGDRNHE